VDDMSGLPIPAPGDLAGQTAQGNALNSLVAGQALGAPPTQSLLSAGLTMASALGSGEISRVATDVLGGASAGFAVGGPYGAVAGAIVGALESLLSVGPSYQGLFVIDDTEGIDHLYKVLVQWNSTNIGTGTRSGEPLGWTLWDYLARVRPPKSTPRPALLLALMQATAAEQDALWPGQGTGSLDGQENAVWTGNGFSHAGSGYGTGGPTMLYNAWKGGWTSAQVAAAAEPLASPLAWLWGQPSEVQDVILNEWYAWATPPDQQGDAGAGATPPEPSTLYADALADTVPPPGKTQTQTLRRAISMAPDPLYFSADLYAQQFGGFNAPGTVLYNSATLVGLATWLGMSLNGASPRALATELLLQQGTVAESGPVPAAFQSLLDDALALARIAESGKSFPGWAGVASPLAKGTPSSTAPRSAPSGRGGAVSPAVASARATVAKFVRMYLGR
jgi:hypothetical protein